MSSNLSLEITNLVRYECVTRRNLSLSIGELIEFSPNSLLGSRTMKLLKFEIANKYYWFVAVENYRLSDGTAAQVPTRGWQHNRVWNRVVTLHFTEAIILIVDALVDSWAKVNCRWDFPEWLSKASESRWVCPMKLL